MKRTSILSILLGALFVRLHATDDSPSSDKPAQEAGSAATGEASAAASTDTSSASPVTPVTNNPTTDATVIPTTDTPVSEVPGASAGSPDSSVSGELPGEDAVSPGVATDPLDSAMPASASDSASADAVTALVADQPPVTDSVNGSPTGGPTATSDVAEKHGLVASIEARITAELNEVLEWSEQLQHSAAAFFDALHSHIDAQAQ